ncbi:MAG: hypothetical protein Q8R04_07660, partial [Nanoarchaeota archaeon]|nr:hypothetical protein [Nanoarchaeota archaeon]
GEIIFPNLFDSLQNGFMSKDGTIKSKGIPYKELPHFLGKPSQNHVSAYKECDDELRHYNLQKLPKL